MTIVLAVLCSKIQIKPTVIFKDLKNVNVPCEEIDYSASSESESNESANESEKRNNGQPVNT